MKNIFPLIILSLALISSPAEGAIVTYDVDFSTSAGTHPMQLIGTITIDADLAFTSAIQSSNLQLIHDGGFPVSLSSTPVVVTGDPDANLDWVVSGNNLSIKRIGTGDSLVQWQSPFGLEFGQFQLGSGIEEHNLFYSDFGHSDTGTLLAAGGVDAGDGFQIGIVPEPSSFAMVMMGITCLAIRRKVK